MSVNFRKLLRQAVTMTLLVTPIFPSLHAGTSASHGIKISVPRLMLLDIKEPIQTFSFAEDTETIRLSTPVAITSSDRQARLNISSSGLPEGITLDIQASTNVCRSEISQYPDGRFSCKVGLKAIKDGELVLRAKRQADVPDGDYKIELSYIFEN